MGESAYANASPHEGTVATTVTVTFNFRPREITITNDSASKALSFKFNSSEDYATLKPTETYSAPISSKKVYLSGTSVPYRVWGIG